MAALPFHRITTDRLPVSGPIFTAVSVAYIDVSSRSVLKESLLGIFLGDAIIAGTLPKAVATSGLGNKATI
jgi:hypothetical protein